MEFVDPIRDIRKIQAIKNNLKGAGRWRDLLLFTVGVNSALRVSDLLQLKVGQFFNHDGSITEKFSLREAKRNKRYDLIINDSIRDALLLYKTGHPAALVDPNYALFFSTTRLTQQLVPIGRGQVWKMMVRLCDDVGAKGNFGTHTLRKTWAYQAWKSGVDLYMIMVILNHNSLDYTKRYLGITDDDRAEILLKLNL